MNFYERFSEICRKNSTTPSRVLINIGLNKSTATSWKKNGTAPSVETVRKIADYFGITVEELLSGTFPEQEKRPVATVRSEKGIKLEKAIRLTERLTDEQLDSLLKFLGIELK